MRSLIFLGILVLPCAAESVAVATPVHGMIHRWITLPSRLEPNQLTVLHAKVGGHLKSISVDVGDAVTAGQQIATLEVPELEADRIKAVAELEVADADLARLQSARVKAPGLVLPQAIDDAAGRQRIAAASLQRTEVLLGYAKITAPFDGVITARHADVGAYIPAGGTTTAGATVTICDLSVLRDRVPVPEQEARFIKPGTLARVILSPTAAPLEAKVSRHGRNVAAPSATLAVEVDLPNPDGKLLAGSYVKTQLAVETHTDARLIPVAALLVEKSSASVFVVKDGKAVKTKVIPGFIDALHAEIPDGLSDTETLIILTGITVTDGQPVTVAK